jgi:hypothetical protein
VAAAVVAGGGPGVVCSLRCGDEGVAHGCGLSLVE